MFSLLLPLIYISFISLGLPDGLLGAAWPSMYPGLGVPVSGAGVLSMIICIGTIASSLSTDRMTRRLGTGKVTALSVALTAVALLGFSFSREYWMLCLLAIPYGLGAGSVDASLNNYVALHYSSRHMSWLHCMWGVGAATGPYIISLVLSCGLAWPAGYQIVGLLQILLTAVLFISLRLWKKAPGEEDASIPPLTLPQTLKIPGAWAVMVTFFCYCALEQTAALWCGTYLTLHAGLPEETAAAFASLFFLGITVGRAVSGFVTIKLNDTQMIRLGMGIIAFGIVTMLLPLGIAGAMAGLLLVGLGCAPIYPCIMHSTPVHFGPARSQALMGIQTASAYVGTALMPPLFGLIANHLSISLMGVFLAVMLVFMVISHELLLKKCSAK